MKPLLKQFLITSFAFIFFLSLFQGISAAQSSGPDVPFQQAVPSFLDEIIKAVKDFVNADAIGPWIDRTTAVFSDFLDDIKLVFIEFQTTVLDAGDNVFHNLAEITQKAENFFQELSGLNQLTQAVQPFLEKVLQSFPSLRPGRVDDVPLQNFYEYYNTAEQRNPWQTGSFFHREDASGQIKENFQETALEQTNSGVQSSSILSQENSVEKDGENIFHLVIKNDQVIEQQQKLPDRTLIHEILRKLKEDHADPDLIQQYENLVALIDQNLNNLQPQSFPPVTAVSTKVVENPSRN